MTQARRFPADPQSVGQARRFVVDELRHHGVDRWPAELLVSELATNVITHAATEFEVEVHVDGVVRVAVADDSIVPPLPRAASADALSGRGMALVAALAERWGVEARRDADGKVVWFELPSPD